MRTEGHWLWVLIKPNFWSNFTEQKISENRPILADKRSALTLIYLATSKSLQSLSYQFRLYLVGVLYIVKWCWSAINDRLENMFIELPNCREKCFEFPENLSNVGITLTRQMQQMENTCQSKFRISPYSVGMWENVDPNNFEYGHFLRCCWF